MVLITRTELIDKSDKVCAHPDTIRHQQAPGLDAIHRRPFAKQMFRILI